MCSSDLFPSHDKPVEREHQRQLEYMGLQAQYNKEQAKYYTELSKEMWDYTNYENQKKQHLLHSMRHHRSANTKFPSYADLQKSVSLV